MRIERFGRLVTCLTRRPNKSARVNGAALTKGNEMAGLFDQLRITLLGFLCGGGLMAIALLLAGVIRT